MGQYPDWWKSKGRGAGGSNTGPTSDTKMTTNIAASTVANPQANCTYVTTQNAPKTNSLVTYADSVVSRYFFVSRKDFTEYMPSPKWLMAGSSL